MKSSRLFFLLILFIINCFILVWLIQDRSHVSGLTATTCNSDEFREQFFCLRLSTKSCPKQLIPVIHLPNFSPQPCSTEIFFQKTSQQMPHLI